MLIRTLNGIYESDKLALYVVTDSKVEQYRILAGTKENPVYLGNGLSKKKARQFLDYVEMQIKEGFKIIDVRVIEMSTDMCVVLWLNESGKCFSLPDYLFSNGEYVITSNRKSMENCNIFIIKYKKAENTVKAGYLNVYKGPTDRGFISTQDINILKKTVLDVRQIFVMNGIDAANVEHYTLHGIE